MVRTTADIIASIILGFITKILIDGDHNTIVLASIFWLLASIYFRRESK